MANDELERVLDERLRIDPAHSIRALGQFRAVPNREKEIPSPLEVQWERCEEEVTAPNPFATFWRRFAAMWIDLLVFLPLSWARSWLESRSKGAAIGLVIPYAVIGLGYTIYGHGRFGQTVGKWVMAVRVVRTNGERIGWREAWLRSSVDLLFTVLGVVGQLAALATISDAEYYGDRRTEHVFAHTPGWAVWAVWIGIIWSLSEVVTMLLNKRRRALHDFIAGTVVIHEPRVRAAKRDGGEAKPR